MDLFSKKEITKFYMAISAKKPKKKKQGRVKGTMVMGRRGSFKLLNNSNKPSASAPDVKNTDGSSSSSKKKGGYAVTRFFTAGLGNCRLSETIKGNTDNIPKTAILFQPHTGKTHQLRVAAKSLAIPILGDVRYGGGSLEILSTGEDKDGYDWNRTFLHAAAMHFELDNESVTIWCPPLFDYLFSDKELSEAFVGLLEKHCDCPPILDAIHDNTRDASILK